MSMKLSKSWIKDHYYLRTIRTCPSTMKGDMTHDKFRLILFAIGNLAIIIISRFQDKVEELSVGVMGVSDSLKICVGSNFYETI